MDKNLYPLERNKIELLSPAGSLKSMQYAFAYGADAIYAGKPRYSLRVRNNEFDIENLKLGIEQAHKQNKKFYVVSNILPHNSKILNYISDMKEIIECSPDALIMADPGLIMLVRESFPDIPIHLSVQANTMNYAAVLFWQKQGVERVILSRELSINEIEEIKQKVPDIELEVFVHGALCMAHSGRCLLSGYINHRDANQGACTNACRWEYKVHSAYQNINGDVVLKNQDMQSNIEDIMQKDIPNIYLLEETGRTGELIPTFEDEHGTYFMNSKDLCAIEHVQKLIKIGVSSLKIEGRTKSFYYVARTAQIYNHAINDALENKPFNNQLRQSLEKLASRGYTDGFLQRHRPEFLQNYETGHSLFSSQKVVGTFSGEKKDEKNDMFELEVNNKVLINGSFELMTISGNRDANISYMEDIYGNTINNAPGSGRKIYIRLVDSKSNQPIDDIDKFSILISNLDG